MQTYFLCVSVAGLILVCKMRVRSGLHKAVAKWQALMISHQLSDRLALFKCVIVGSKGRRRGMMSVKPYVWLRMSWVSNLKQEPRPLQTQPSQRLRWHQLVIEGRTLFLLHALAYLSDRVPSIWEARPAMSEGQGRSDEVVTFSFPVVQHIQSRNDEQHH